MSMTCPTSSITNCRTPEDYVYRIGRTGRAGKMGNAISLVSAHEVGYLVDIEN